jgi:hypothetical protein
LCSIIWLFMFHQKRLFKCFRIFRCALWSQQFVYGCLHNDSILCSTRCNVVEDVHHLFLNCPLSSVAWYSIISWLWILYVLLNNVIALPSQFCGEHDLRKPFRNCFQVV